MSDQSPNNPVQTSVLSAPLPTSGLAVASLVLSILSWFMLPVIGAVVGLVLGYSARQNTRGVAPTESGDGIATAGIVISWIHIGLATCVCVALAALFMLGLLGPLIGSTFSTINSSLQSP